MRTSNVCNNSQGSLGDVTFTRFSRALLLTDIRSDRLLSLSFSLSPSLSFSQFFLITFKHPHFPLIMTSLYISLCVLIKRNSVIRISFGRSWKWRVAFPFSLSFLFPSTRLIAPTLPFIHSLNAFSPRVPFRKLERSFMRGRYLIPRLIVSKIFTRLVWNRNNYFVLI